MKKTIIIALISIVLGNISTAQKVNFFPYSQVSVKVIRNGDTAYYVNKIGLKWINGDPSYIDNLEYLYWSIKTFSVDTEFKVFNDEMIATGKVGNENCTITYKRTSAGIFNIVFTTENNDLYIFDIDLANVM